MVRPIAVVIVSATWFLAFLPGCADSSPAAGLADLVEAQDADETNSQDAQASDFRDAAVTPSPDTAAPDVPAGTDTATGTETLVALSYPIVDTSQSACYGNTSAIPCPATGLAFFGQDAQWARFPAHYVASTDGVTVADLVTGLTWQHSPDTNGDGKVSVADKLTWAGAQARPAALNAAKFGGFDDWRLPTIKELYSLIRFTGTDPSGLAGSDTSALVPFLDTEYFDFVYGDTTAGERIIDSQYASSNVYVGPELPTEGGKLFGVNFADGRIKGYGLKMIGGAEKTFFVQCVRGNPAYGVNDMQDNGDGTVTDLATGLMWSRDDSGKGMNWADALAWVAARNAESYLGHADWRLPHVKELQSLVDYARSPDTTASAAIDPVFACTSITNEGGQADWPYYWSGTSHAASSGGSAGAYVAFGRGLGYMSGGWVDVHGAGCQRSDPKDGDPAAYPQGHGPQGDAIRVFNYVRPVRDAAGTTATADVSPEFVEVAEIVAPDVIEAG